MGVLEINLTLLGYIVFAVIAGVTFHYTLENHGIIWSLVALAGLLIIGVNVIGYFVININQ